MGSLLTVVTHPRSHPIHPPNHPPILSTHSLTHPSTYTHLLTPPTHPPTPYPPLPPSLSLGIHEWSVHIDKSDRGHVFVGVVTAEASMDSYVGSDRCGWGIIGTRALWHGRAKITSDFGPGFGNQSVVYMRLDTEEGKLSISTDSDPIWYLAFDRLPSDIELFPAVSLYHREDKIMLAPTPSPESSNGRGTSSSGIMGGHISGGGKHLNDHRPSRDVRLFMKYVLAMCAKIDSFLRIAERPGLGPSSSSSSSSGRGVGEMGAGGIDSHRVSGTGLQHHMSLVDRSAILSHPFIGLLLPSLAAAIVEAKPSREHTGFIAIHLAPAFTVLTRRLAALYDELAVISREKNDGELKEGLEEVDGTTSSLPPNNSNNNNATTPTSSSGNASDPLRSRGGGGSLGGVAATSYVASAGGPWTVRSGTTPHIHTKSLPPPPPCLHILTLAYLPSCLRSHSLTPPFSPPTLTPPSPSLPTITFF